MSNDYSELIEYLDQKFERTASREIDTKESLKEIKSEIHELRTTIHALVDSVDKLAKAVDDLRIEYSAVAMKVDRHEKWLHQIAEKLDIKLEHE